MLTAAGGERTDVDAEWYAERRLPSLVNYVAHADVTALVAAGGAGSYTVADVLSTTGSATRYGGWSLVVAYSDPGLPVRNLAVFDGYVHIGSGQPADVTVDGFQTPSSGEVRTRLGGVAFEGDRGVAGDRFRLDGTALSTAQRPVGNFFNSSITDGQSDVTTKEPDFRNQLGVDLFRLDVDGLLDNGATSATLRFSSTGDAYEAAALTFATELFAPDLRVTKAADLPDTDPPAPGDRVTYLIDVVNDGDDAAIDVRLTDALPPGFVLADADPVRITAGPGSELDDQSDRIDVDGRDVEVRLGEDADAVSGGRLTPGQSTTVRVSGRVGGTPTELANVADVSYVGADTGIDLVGRSNEVVTDIAPPPPPPIPLPRCHRPPRRRHRPTRFPSRPRRSLARRSTAWKDRPASRRLSSCPALPSSAPRSSGWAQARSYCSAGPRRSAPTSRPACARTAS